MRTIARAAAIAVAAAALAAAPAVASADTVKVQQNGDGGWAFNRDASTSTPYEFSLAERSIGGGSLHVLPIGSNPSDKFVAEKQLGIPVGDLSSISYDFLIAGNGDAGDAEEFYLNVYTNLPGSTTFYDCRFDYVPATGSTADFTTATVAPTDTPTHVQPRPVSQTCPATLAEMPAGSTISFFSLNVGDTGASDAGLAGYLDNVVVSTADGSTTYDFDPTKDACKKGGFEAGGYNNQGQCVAAIQS